jgi:hypothetical protein
MYWRTWVRLAEGAGIFLLVTASIYDLKSRELSPWDKAKGQETDHSSLSRVRGEERMVLHISLMRLPIVRLDY